MWGHFAPVWLLIAQIDFLSATIVVDLLDQKNVLLSLIAMRQEGRLRLDLVVELQEIKVRLAI